LFIGRDLAMDGLRSIAANQGKVLAANIWGKVKTAIQMGLIPVLFLKGFPFSMLNFGSLDVWMVTRWDYTYILTNILVGITLFFSIFSFVVYVIQNKAVLKEEKK
jgi:CDP-diacylglycerol--glycerol-3-phosphate 3-phosphatidyltransferase